MTRSTVRSLLLIAGLVPALASAASPYDPDAPVVLQPHPPLSRPADPNASMGELDWRAANTAVGAFPRGHIDILRWEAANSSSTPASPRTDNALLLPAEAVRIALASRPERFATTDMSAQQRAHADIAAVELARDVHRAWIVAVAAEQSLRHAQDVFDATEAGTELAVRMTRAGNWGQERLMREQLALSEAGLQLTQARQGALSAREALIRLLRLWGDETRFSLPDALPELPETPLSDVGLEATALRNHPQLPLAAIEAERARRGVASGVSGIWTDISATALSGIDHPANDAENPLANLLPAAPVIDLRRAPGGADALQAARAHAHAAELAVRIRSHVREAYHQYRIAYDLARVAQEDVARLQDAVLEETVMRYNGMLKSTWDLLAGARDRIASVDAALAARRDFWLTHTNLQAVLAGADYAGPDAIGAASARTERVKGH